MKLRLARLAKSALLLGVVSVTSACISDVVADQEIRQVSLFGENGNKIRIINGYDKDKVIYRVNGKTFTWRDLSKSQQEALLEVERPLKHAEQQLDIEEMKMERSTDQLDAKADEMAALADKMDALLDNADYDKMTVKQIQAHQDKISQAIQVHETTMKQKAKELTELKEKIYQIDKALIEQVEAGARDYERVLVEVASEL